MRVTRDKSGLIMNLGQQTMDTTLSGIGRAEQPRNITEQEILSYSYFSPPTINESPKPTSATSKGFQIHPHFFSPKAVARVESPVISHLDHDSLQTAFLVL